MGQNQADQAVPAGFFPDVVGIRAGDPVFGPLPTDSQLGQRIVDALPAHPSAGNAHLDTYLGSQLKRPDTRVEAKGAWTLVQQRTQPFAPLGIEDLMGGVGPRGFGLQCSQTAL